ncbi:MAG: citrate/2-methylcitrate synthase [Myxococcota bacterium]
MRRTGHLSAREAAEALGVSRATLYAYVSRGLIRSERGEGSRERRYRAEDIWMLLRRKEGRRDPARAAEQSLFWGAPVLPSELTLIEDGRLYYRGHPVEALASSTTFEDVAALLWGAPDLSLPDVAPVLPPTWPTLRDLARGLPPLEAFQLVLSAVSAHDPAGFDLSAEGVRRTGVRILRLLAAVAGEVEPGRRPVAEVLQRRWCPRHGDARPLLEAVLVLLADHELNVSTFTARCVASAHASPYAAVVAGLSALRGVRHGAASEQVLALFDEVGRPSRARGVIEARLRRGERIPGFGHAVYSGEDPRAVLLDRLLREARPGSSRLDLPASIEQETRAVIDQQPNVDFVLAALSHVLGLPSGALITLFGVSRSVGWVAHALEQYSERSLIRPRARYVGVPPNLREGRHPGTQGARRDP